MTDYPRPALTVDFVVFDGPDKVLLVKRGKDPFAGCWALPGGYVNDGETVEEAARRELKEETGLSVRRQRLVGVYSNPGRDPRGWVVSVAFWEDVQDYDSDVTVKGADDAVDAQWIEIAHDTDQVKAQLAFDHGDIIRRAQNLRHFRHAF